MPISRSRLFRRSIRDVGRARSTRTLLGLMSRWTTRCSCMYATADRTLCKSCATACSEKDARAPDRGPGGGGGLKGFLIKGPKDDLTGVPQHLRRRRCRGPQRRLGTPSSHPSPTGRRSMNDQMPLARGVRVSTETRIVLLSQVDLWGEQPCGRP